MTANKKIDGNITPLLLCGGKGERLRPLTASTPKPLITIKEKPILYYIVSHLEKFGFEKLVVAAGYKSGMISDYFSDNHKGINVQIVDSGDVDIIRRIKDAGRYLTSDFIVCYGDTLSDVNLDQLIHFHDSHPGKATVTVWPFQSQFGILDVNSDGLVTSFVEKPVLNKWINIGYFYFEHSILGWLDKCERFEDFIPYLLKRKELYGFRHNGVHITVNTLSELDEAEKNIEKIEMELVKG